MGRNRTLGSPLEQVEMTASFMTQPHVDQYLIDASLGSPVDVTLDPSAFDGDRVELVDYGGNAREQPINVVATGSQSIAGFGASLSISVSYGGVVLTYNSADKAWVAQINCCGTGEGGGAFVQGGNAFGAAALLGTTDDNELDFITDGTRRVRITAAGLVGIGPGTPLGTLDIGGSVVEQSSAVMTANYTVDSGSVPDLNVLTDTTAGAITITLPAAPVKGRFVRIVDATGSAAAHSVTVAGNGELINGAATQSISRAYGFMALLNVGGAWNEVGTL